jgi:hypothetical protein
MQSKQATGLLKPVCWSDYFRNSSSALPLSLQASLSINLPDTFVPRSDYELRIFINPSRLTACDFHLKYITMLAFITSISIEYESIHFYFRRVSYYA